MPKHGDVATAESAVGSERTHFVYSLPMPRLVLILATVICCAATGCESLRGDPEAVTIEIGDERFTVDVANDDARRIQGLKGVTEINPSGGMIFIFPNNQVRSFWMVDCVVDIDVMFLDPQGRVTAVHTMKVEPPPRAEEPRSSYERRLPGYSSSYPAQFAIELRAGTLQRLGIEVNSKVPLDLTRLKAVAR